MMRYIKQPDGTFKPEGSITSRYVRVRRFKNGFWIEPICELLRTRAIEIIETTEPQFLPADIYEFIEAEKEEPEAMSDETKEKLKKLDKKRKSEKPLMTCAYEGCGVQYARGQGRYPNRFCPEHRK